MSSSDVTPLVSQGSRVGPVFCTKYQFAFVKVSNEDRKKAVVNMTSMTLVDYVDRCEYPQATLHSDQSLFVPIYCKECYVTNEEDYTEALASIVSCESDKLLVGMCSVFRVSQGEVYPESRKDLIVGNNMLYSGTVTPNPARLCSYTKSRDTGTSTAGLLTIPPVLLCRVRRQRVHQPA